MSGSIRFLERELILKRPRSDLLVQIDALPFPRFRAWHLLLSLLCRSRGGIVQ